MVSTSQHWQKRIGLQRDWIWRGWQIRYTYKRPSQPNQQLTTPIILLHGFGAAVGHWRHNISVLSEQHTVYALDLLGFGASKKAAADYNIELWVEQVYDFWQTFIRQPVVIVGNSLGSLVCLAVAATHPEMVQGITMINLPDVSLQQEAIPSWLRPIESSTKKLIASPPLLKALFKVIRHPAVIRRWARMAYVNQEAVSDELVEILSTPPQDVGAAKAFCYLFRGASNRRFAPSAKVLLANLQIPILLIWGRQDKFIPPSLAPMFASLNPQIELFELENAGHCPHDECPERFNQILLDWLGTKLGQGKENN